MSSTTENGSAAKPLALVADDDSDILALVSLGLQKAGYAVVEAQDGRQALEVAQEQHPEVAIMDLRMPELDGLEVVRRIRADEGTSGMLVIALSARVREAHVAEGLAAGADEYVLKPFSIKELVELVELKLFQRRPASQP